MLQIERIHYILVKWVFLKSNITQNILLVDCRWSDWRLGDCSVTCGDGVRENTRFKEQEELFGGAPCEGVVSHTEACINRICPGKTVIETFRETVEWEIKS